GPARLVRRGAQRHAEVVLAQLLDGRTLGAERPVEAEVFHRERRRPWRRGPVATASGPGDKAGKAGDGKGGSSSHRRRIPELIGRRTPSRGRSCRRAAGPATAPAARSTRGRRRGRSARGTASG